MLQEYGIVTALDGPYAWVETQRRSACGQCGTAGCGTGALAQVLGRKTTRIRVWNSQNARVGDSVRLGLDEGALLRGSLWMYLVPLSGLFAGSILYETLAQGGFVVAGDGYTVLAGLAGFAAGLAGAGYGSRRRAGDPRYQAVMLGPE